MTDRVSRILQNSSNTHTFIVTWHRMTNVVANINSTSYKSSNVNDPVRSLFLPISELDGYFGLFALMFHCFTQV